MQTVGEPVRYTKINSSMHGELISKRIDELDRFHTLSVCRRSESKNSITAEIDDFVAKLSDHDLIFSGLRNRWLEIQKTEAQVILKRILSYDLAYGTPEISSDESDHIVADFLSIFETSGHYYTNGTFSDDFMSWGGHGSVANATFETGVVAVDSSHIGILWCHDED